MISSMNVTFFINNVAGSGKLSKIIHGWIDTILALNHFKSFRDSFEFKKTNILNLHLVLNQHFNSVHQCLKLEIKFWRLSYLSNTYHSIEKITNEIFFLNNVAVTWLKALKIIHGWKDTILALNHFKSFGDSFELKKTNILNLHLVLNQYFK